MTNTEANNFNERLNYIRLIADDLPASLIIHRVEDLHIVYMNKPGLDILGTTLEELQGLNQEQYFIKYFNPDDSNDYVPKIINIIKTRSKDHVSYFQQVRQPQNMEWLLYVSNTRIFVRNTNGDATYLITIAGRLDPVHHITAKVNRLMDEVSFLRRNALLFASLTKREKEVLKYIAAGLNSGEIGEKLFISTATVDTHRRNIRSKLGIKNNYDAVKFAQAYNLV